MSPLEATVNAVLIVVVVLLIAAVIAGVAWAFQPSEKPSEPSPMGTGPAPTSAPLAHPNLDDETNAAFADLVGHEAQLAGQLARIWTRGKRKAKEKTT